MKPDRHTIETAGDYSSFAINESILRSELFVAHRWMNLYRLRVYRERFPPCFNVSKLFLLFLSTIGKFRRNRCGGKEFPLSISALVQSNPFKLGLNEFNCDCYAHGISQFCPPHNREQSSTRLSEAGMIRKSTRGI